MDAAALFPYLAEGLVLIFLVIGGFQWRRGAFQKDWLEELRNRVADLEKQMAEERAARIAAEKRAENAEKHLEVVLKQGVGQGIGEELRELLKEQTQLLRELLEHNRNK